jgi:UDP-N-acetylglucosamine acyltransferase
MNGNYYDAHGVYIGDNNFFHVRNMIYSGTKKKTFFGNNNKILGETHIGHDCQIHNDVSIYTRALLCGHVEMLRGSNAGVYSFIHQNKIIGQYSMIGGNSSITKHVFPYCVNINNVPHRINTIKLSKEIGEHKQTILELSQKFANIKSKNIMLDEFLKNVPHEISVDIKLFLSLIKFK